MAAMNVHAQAGATGEKTVIVSGEDLYAGITVSSESQNSSIVTLTLSASSTGNISKQLVRNGAIWIGLGFQNGVKSPESPASMVGPNGTDFILVHVSITPDQRATIEHRRLQAEDDKIRPKLVGNFSGQATPGSWVKSTSFTISPKLQLTASLECQPSTPSLQSSMPVDLMKPVRVIFAYGVYGSSGPMKHTVANRKVVLTQTGTDTLCVSHQAPIAVPTKPVRMAAGSSTNPGMDGSTAASPSPKSTHASNADSGNTASSATTSAAPCSKLGTLAAMMFFAYIALKTFISS